MSAPPPPFFYYSSWEIFLCGCLLALNWESPGISRGRMRVLSKAVAWPQQRGWEEEGEEGEGTNPHHSPPAITSPHHHHPRSTLPFLNFFVFLFRARATRRSPPNCIFNLFDEPRKTVCCSVFSFFFLSLLPSANLPLSSQRCYIFVPLPRRLVHLLSVWRSFVTTSKHTGNRIYRQMLPMKYLSRKL